jgi:phage shock protein PspC (stress-responsive transcriptional regulator)
LSALDHTDAVRPVSTGFRLNKVDGKLMGVCAGIADRFGIDATLVRLGFVAGALLGFGSLVVVYIAIGLIAD